MYFNCIRSTITIAILKILFINWFNIAKMSEIYNKFHGDFAKFYFKQNKINTTKK